MPTGGGFPIRQQNRKINPFLQLTATFFWRQNPKNLRQLLKTLIDTIWVTR
jgi:hypothetical protein